MGKGLRWRWTWIISSKAKLLRNLLESKTRQGYGRELECSSMKHFLSTQPLTKKTWIFSRKKRGLWAKMSATVWPLGLKKRRYIGSSSFAPPASSISFRWAKKMPERNLSLTAISVIVIPTSMTLLYLCFLVNEWLLLMWYNYRYEWRE